MEAFPYNFNALPNELQQTIIEHAREGLSIDQKLAMRLAPRRIHLSDKLLKTLSQTLVDQLHVMDLLRPTHLLFLNHLKFCRSDGIVPAAGTISCSLKMATTRQDVVELVALALEQAGLEKPESIVAGLQRGIEDAPLDEFTSTLAERSEMFLEWFADMVGHTTAAATDSPRHASSVEELLGGLYPIKR